MFVARILYPVRTLGPGNRIGIWFCGCSHGCKGCSNPELWQRLEEYRITPRRLMELVRSVSDSAPVDGFTLTGGDPMEQPELAGLLPELREISGDILLYTGYTLEQLREIPGASGVLENVSVLIDGEYIAERNTGCPLRGSDNQRVIFLDESLRAVYEEYMRQGNMIQNFTVGNSVVSVGIHGADYPVELERRLTERNLVKDGG